MWQSEWQPRIYIYNFKKVKKYELLSVLKNNANINLILFNWCEITFTSCVNANYKSTVIQNYNALFSPISNANAEMSMMSFPHMKVFKKIFYFGMVKGIVNDVNLTQLKKIIWIFLIKIIFSFPFKERM